MMNFVWRPTLVWNFWNCVPVEFVLVQTMQMGDPLYSLAYFLAIHQNTKTSSIKKFGKYWWHQWNNFGDNNWLLIVLKQIFTLHYVLSLSPTALLKIHDMVLIIYVYTKAFSHDKPCKFKQVWRLNNLGTF